MNFNLSRNSFQTIIFTLIGFVIAIISSIIINRGLGPEGRGLYGLLLSSLNFLMAFSQFGVPEALLFQSSKIKKKYASFCYNNILVTVAVTVLSAFLLKTLIPFIKDTILSGGHESFIWLTFIILPFNLIFIFFTRLLQLDGQLLLYNSLHLARKIINLFVIVFCFYLLGSTAKSAILGIVITIIISVFITLGFSWKMIRTNFVFDYLLLKETMINGMKVHWGMINHTIGIHAATFILNFYLDLESVGIFSVAMALSGFLLVIPESIRTALQSSIISVVEKNKEPLFFTKKVIRHIVLLLLVFNIIIIIFGPHFIIIMYGNDFSSVYYPLLILIFGILFQAIGQLISSQLTIDGHLNWTSLSATLGVISSLIGAWLIIPIYGLHGAAISVLINHFIHFLFLFILYKKKYNAGVFEFIPTRIDIMFYVDLLSKKFKNIF